MRSCHKHLRNIIILDGLHSLDSLATTVLTLEIVGTHTLDVTNLCHCDDIVGLRNQIFHRNIKFIVSDLGSSVIAIFISDCKNFGTDNCEKLFLIGKNRL